MPILAEHVQAYLERYGLITGRPMGRDTSGVKGMNVSAKVGPAVTTPISLAAVVSHSVAEVHAADNAAQVQIAPI